MAMMLDTAVQKEATQKEQIFPGTMMGFLGWKINMRYIWEHCMPH